MPKPTDISLREVTTSTQYITYRAPIKFGGRVVNDVVLLDVTVDVETRDGRRGRGAGSMPMGNIWAWPTRDLPAEKTLAAMIELGQRLAREANGYRGCGHPLEITRELEASYASAAGEVTRADRKSVV
jgi:hypothetical protein